MPGYSENIKEELRARNDIGDVVGEVVPLKGSGSTLMGLCPFHSEKTPSFSVTPGKGIFYCFGCHEGGDVFSFVQKYYNYTFTEAMEYLADRVGMTIEKTKDTGNAAAIREEKSLIIEINTCAARYFHANLMSDRGKAAYDYFIGRGLSPNTIVKFGLGYSDKRSDDLYRHLKEKGYSDELIKKSGLAKYSETGGAYDTFSNRAMFPIFDMNKKVIGFGGRVMGDAKPKYLNSSDTQVFEKKKNLYAYHIARSSRSKKLILCEGYMDVIALHQAGFDYAVASLGTSLTEGHVNLIKRLSHNIYLCYDSDEAGQQAAKRAIDLLAEADIHAKIIHMDPYKDPDEFIKALGPEQFNERINEAENSYLFTWGLDIQKYDMNDPTEKTDFLKYLAESIIAAGGMIGWEGYVDAACKKFNLDKKTLRDFISNKISASPEIQTANVNSSPKPKPVRSRTVITGEIRAQQKLLTWLPEDPGLYVYIKDYITPEDFSEGIYRGLAKELFTQLEQGYANVPHILANIPDEAMEEAAACFSTPLEEGYKAEKGKALTELIYNIKFSALKKREAEAGGDIALKQQCIMERMALDKFKRDGITV